MSENKQDSGDSAKWFCIDCKSTFVKEEEAKEHFKKIGTITPINEIIRPISELNNLKKRRV